MHVMTRSVIGTLAATLSVASYGSIDQQCQPFMQPSVAVAVDSEESVRFSMNAALLKPQLESLLAQQWGVQRVVWYADQHHIWPTDFELNAPHWDALLESLLAPYQLRVVLHPNAMAVIDYLPEAKQL